MSINKAKTRVLGRKIGRELSAAELSAVTGGSGATQPVAGSSGRDTDYS